jgi:ArsC family
VREAIRIKGTPYHELGLDDPKLSDDQLLDAMLEQPILINRPFVVTPWGVRLSRPSERVLDILPCRYPRRAPSRKRTASWSSMHRETACADLSIGEPTHVKSLCEFHGLAAGHLRPGDENKLGFAII